MARSSRPLLLFTLCSLLVAATAAHASTPIPQDGVAGVPRAFSPDGSLLVTSGDRLVELWRLSDRVVLGRYDLGEPVSSATFTADGSHVVLAGSRGRLEVLTVPGLRSVSAASGHESWICTVLVLADGTLVSADGQGFLTFRDPLTLEIRAKFVDDEPDPINEVALHPDGEQVALARRRSVIVATAEGVVATLPTKYPNTAVAWSPDGTRLAIATVQGNIMLWDGHADQAQVIAEDLGQQQYADQLLWLPDDGGLLAAVKRGTLCILDLDGAIREDLGYARGTGAVVVRSDPQGRTLAVFHDQALTLLRWPGRQAEDLVDLRGFGHGLSWNPVRSQLAFGSGGGDIAVWDLESGDLWTVRGDDRLGPAEFSPDGTRLAVVHPTSVVVYDAADGERLRSYELQGTYGSFGCGRGARHELRTSQPIPAALGDVTWRPDGLALAVSARDQVAVLATEDGAILDVMAAGELMDGLGVASFAFAPDNHTVAMGTTKGWIYVADLADDSCVTHGEVFSAAAPGASWSPDGSRVAFSGEDGKVRVVDLPTNNVCHTLSHGEVAVTDVAWSPDGTRLATTSGRQLHSWSVEPWSLEGTFDMGLRTTWDAEFSPDGRFVAVHSGPVVLRRLSDGATVVLYHGEDGRLVWSMDRDWWADGRGADHMLLREDDDLPAIRMTPLSPEQRDEGLLRAFLAP